jgi:hypothetical protein
VQGKRRFGTKEKSLAQLRKAIWLRGLDLNQRSRGRGIMSLTARSQIFDKIHRLPSVA